MFQKKLFTQNVFEKVFQLHNYINIITQTKTNFFKKVKCVDKSLVQK